MATAVVLLMCSNVFVQVIPVVRGSTHWVVTEDGRIQAQLDSVFNLQRPYDLVALLKQEDRARMLENLKQELLAKKEQIDGSEDKNTALEQHFYRTDPDCLTARIPLPEFDLYISTVLPLENKGILPEDYIDVKSAPTTEPAIPDCTKVIQLDFSFHAFEHLLGVQDRWNLSGTPEKGLKNAITQQTSVDDYGHLVHDALYQNKTSWVLYNMAAFYWRIKGDPYHVIECVRRALHFSPRWQKDVALVSLANVLHRSHFSNEAAIVMHAALDVSHDLNVNHFTLGNIYANKHGREVLDCSWRKPASAIDDDFMSSWQTKKRTKQDRPPNPMDGQPVDYTRPIRSALYQQLSPEIPEELGKLSYKEKGWPQKEECDTHVQKFPTWNEFPTTYLPPENKGFEVRALLAEAQGRKKGDEHPLPWYPPVCVTLAGIPEGPRSYDHIPSMKERTKIPLRLIDHSMRQTLLDMVEKKDITEEEVGQRILTALKQKIGPSWILYNLAGLYWRILGNNYHGIECIRRSLYFAPDCYKDVPLVNLANILYKWGRVDDAITVMRDAITVNPLEPESHFFLGNLLAAKSNLSGAVEHYEQALRQSAIHKDAFSMLRVTRCYQKYHQSAQSQAPVSNPKSRQPCVNKVNTDSHVICKQKKGKESCVVETPSQVCKSCKQICAITPIKPGSCGNAKSDTVSGAHKKGDKQSTVVLGDQCGGASSFSPLSDTVGPNPLMDPNFNSKLDDISEHYRQTGVCSGEDCHRLMIEMSQHYQPHTRLEVIDGNLHQKYIFVDSVNDIHPGPEECIIYNSGERSPGCSTSQFKPFDLDLFVKHLNQPLCNNESGNHGNNYDKMNNMETQATDDKKSADARNVDIEMILPEHEQHRAGAKAKLSDVDIVKLAPDPTRHILIRTAHEVLTYDKCVDLRKTDQGGHHNHWVSVSTVGVKLSEHIDFTEDLGGALKKPVCSITESQDVAAFDLISSLQDVTQLTYEPETDLEETLCNLGSEPQTVGAMATRIARKLEKDETSWVLAIKAALYWRVVGDAGKAITCLRVAYKHSPHSYVHVSLLSLVSILLKAKQNDDALTVANIALEVAPYLTAVHYAIANVYLAKEDWLRARQFYESTLSLDPSFEMAKTRLWRIQCDIILSSVPVQSLLRIQRPCM
ncbi:hypothetical protein NP493_797g01042 [Ridgeia piscesae]|uniref:Tetratricopeptide repeat protein 17 n=1 Tax=Ridgeia piscesae TaxID=27915 RepID=A0AAD9NN40_RIDPI|nr:hypothetical protein NP493_797g01042 [Ridgeia piscesae]